MAVAVSKKKKEEENLKALRELTAIEHNKKCLECHQRGITYVDTTTNGFVCVQCSGYLRGLNPPHRVKSISMTTFSDAEIKQLKEGGNEVAKKTWMGKWDPKKDREPDKKNEVAFKEYLIAKYERRSWYKSAADIKKEEQQASPTTDQTKLPTPTTSVKSVERPRGGQSVPAISPPTAVPTSTVIPKPTTAPSTATAAAAVENKTSSNVDLLGDLGGDPFVAKPPVGGVSVLPPLGGGPPLLPGSSSNQGEFGAFIGSTPSSVPGPSLLHPSTGQTSNAASTSLSGSDKYAALASLDETLRELKVKDEPPQQPFGGGPVIGPGGGRPAIGQGGGGPVISPGGGRPAIGQGGGGPVLSPGGGGPIIGPGGGTGGGFGPGVTNPFGAPASQVTQQQSNPFAGGGGGQAFGMGMPQQQMGGAQFGQMGGAGGFGTGMPPQQQQFGGFGAQQAQRPAGLGPQQWGQAPQQQQSFGGFGGVQQQMSPTQQMQWRGQLQPQMGMMGGAQQMPAQQQWGGQTQQWGAGVGAQFSGGVRPQQPQQAGGFGGGMQQFGGGSFGGGAQQQQFGGGAFGGTQMGGPGGGFNWGVASSSSSGFSQTASATSRSLDSPKLQPSSQSSSLGGSGWSTGLTKPSPSNSGWGQQATPQSSASSGMGWSTSMTSGTPPAGGGWSGMTSQMGGVGGVSGAASWGGVPGAGGFGQQQPMGAGGGGQTGWGTFQQQPTQQGFMGGGGAPNPFASGSQTTNPFL